MKSMFSLVAAVLVAVIGMASLQANAFNGPAKMAYLECKTVPNKFGGQTQLSIVPKGQSAQGQLSYEISGSVSGGIAQFIRLIGPVEVVPTYAADMASYTTADGFELNVITTAFGGTLKQVGVLKEGSGFPSEQMNCQTQFTP